MSQQNPLNRKALDRLDGVVLRLVEQQGAQATRRTTDSLDAQAWQEDFIEGEWPAVFAAMALTVK